MKRKPRFALHIGLAGLAVALLAGGSQHASAAQTGTTQATSQAGVGAQPSVPVGTGFTYQGSLKDGANPANGQYDFTFTLFDALSGGNQVGTTLTVSNQTVTDGLFTVTLDFGTGAITGDARWLEIAVRQSGGGGYTTLSPRQPLTATPYAQSLVPGAVIDGSSPASNAVLKVSNSAGNAYGVWGQSTSSDGIGLLGTGDNVSTTATGVYGTAGGTGVTGFAAVKGVYGLASGTNGWGVHGVANGGGTATGVRGESTGGYGGYFYSGNRAVYGEGTAGNTWGGWFIGGVRGVYGTADSGTAVRGAAYGTGSAGVEGDGMSSSYGLHGTNSGNYAAIWGDTTVGSNGTAIYGTTAGTTSTSVYGSATGANSTGVLGQANAGSNAVGVRGSSSSGWAGWFDGNVNVTGTCCAASAGTFKIDHPLDPENKYLAQSAVESPDMMNIYNGNVTTDAKGEAVVTLPSYVEALNKDFLYQLTVMGQFAQAIVASKINGNRFTIKTDKPNVEVSWQVTGIRKDPYAQTHPVQVEVDKSANEKGKYIHPELYGQPESKAINYEYLQRVQQQPAPADESMTKAIESTSRR